MFDAQYLVVGGGLDAIIMMVKHSFWLFCHQFLAACSQNLLGVTPTKNCQRHDIPPGDGEVMMLHFYAGTYQDYVDLSPGGLYW